ncbi:hypothetical protein EIN_475570 [Entamoeba invadens IP1]|uniref:Uncharacterized protein n=1 Tax=Entamoeba invadens IP1 TaxID=370355 RepID=A0A0A1U9R4_ENTIV|nr:hypothetical protein EIN_475570 [Entamoeba invadens IP1]ELP88865.1 hypothetical protein EIN_475570 [Entamoeba invadens IP1]|eukprot:XP_004255636.1 hypothetical protein EIN_475570 [Entamoeba invadens IP1]
MQFIFRIPPALQIILSVVLVNNTVLFTTCYKYIMSASSFSFFKVNWFFSYAVASMLFVGGVTSTVLFHFKKRITFLISGIVQIIVFVMSLVFVIVSLVVLFQTETRVKSFWYDYDDDNKNEVRKLIESYWRCCGYDVISPADCGCTDDTCYSRLCQQYFQSPFTETNILLFVFMLFGAISSFLAMASIIALFFKKEKQTYVKFR